MSEDSASGKKFFIRSVSCGTLWQVWDRADFLCMEFGLPFFGPHSIGRTIPEAWERAKRVLQSRRDMNIKTNRSTWR